MNPSGAGGVIMLDPKSTFFQTELKWPPLEEFAISEDVVVRLFNKMREPDGYRYDNLTLQTDKPTLHRKGSGGQSLCQFGSESITIEESDEQCHIETFVEVVETVLGGLEEDDVPPFFLQRVKIQCLCQTAHAANAVQLLAGKVSHVFDAVEPFGRPPAFFGVRFRFPPIHLVSPSPREGESGADDEQSADESEIEQAIAEGRIEEKAGFVTLRLESYAKDSRQVWMEIAGTYPHFEEPMALADVAKIIGNIRSAYEFLTNNSKSFLDQFDTEEGHDQ